MHAVVYVLFMKNTFIYYILCLNEKRERLDQQCLLTPTPHPHPLLRPDTTERSVVMKNIPKTGLSSLSSAFRFIAQSTGLCQLGTVLCQHKMTKQNKGEVQRHVLNTSGSQQRSVLKTAFEQTRSPQKHIKPNNKKKNLTPQSSTIAKYPGSHFSIL